MDGKNLRMAKLMDDEENIQSIEISVRVTLGYRDGVWRPRQWRREEEGAVGIAGGLEEQRGSSDGFGQRQR